MSRRRRAVVLGALAIVCAAGSAALATRYQAGVEAGFGETRTVVVLTDPLQRGRVIGEQWVQRSLATAEVPVRFLAPDALTDPLAALGRRTGAELPAGSILLASHLEVPVPRDRGPELPEGLRPVEVRVDGAGSIGPAGRGDTVDIVAANEPGLGTGPPVETIVKAAPLLDLKRAGAGAEPGSPQWLATVALDRSRALAVIEAENFAREVRLLPR